VSFGVLFGFDEREQIDQSPHDRDGHAPFLRDAKSNFKETLVSDFECVDFVTCGSAKLMHNFTHGDV
jgi:hypothetical protein